MNVTKQEFDFMVQSLTTDLITILTEKDHLSVSKAFDVLYQSNTFAKLCDANTGLYYQSARYVYSYLVEEKKEMIDQALAC
ncbi:MAG: hypothetical protein MJZ33_03055 [Paludibacteraceae bacterium]|nr:hypothetical protein [Paludibacteraceae bacterium]